MWNNETEEVFLADIDRLEVLASSRINYEVAINSVILDYTSRGMDIKSIPVTVDECPGISVGALNMLKQYFGAVEVG